VQAPTFPLIAVGSGLAVRCLIGEGFASHSLLFVVNVMGRRGSPLSTSGKISSWSGRLTAYILPPFYSYTSRPVGCNRRYLRSCEAEPFVEVAAWMGHSLGHAGRPAWVGGGPIDDVKPLPLGGAGPTLLVDGVGPPQM
jgi:hypothetical protein